MLATLIEKFVNKKEFPLTVIENSNASLSYMNPAETLFGFTYHAHMIPPFAPEHTLILGYGGGQVAELMRKIWGNGLKITGVDTEYVETGYEEFRRVTMDACEFVKDCSKGVFKNKFDYIIVDLFENGETPGFVFMEEFAVRIKEICKKLVSINTLATDFRRLKAFYDYGFKFERHTQIFATMVTYWSVNDKTQ